MSLNFYPPLLFKNRKSPQAGAIRPQQPGAEVAFAFRESVENLAREVPPGRGQLLSVCPLPDLLIAPVPSPSAWEVDPSFGMTPGLQGRGGLGEAPSVGDTELIYCFVLGHLLSRVLRHKSHRMQREPTARQ